jgi:hypothetical protein
LRELARGIGVAKRQRMRTNVLVGCLLFSAACGPELDGGPGGGGAGGKADGECTTAAAEYVSWLNDVFLAELREGMQGDQAMSESVYGEARALAESAPCGSSDEAYLAWAGLAAGPWTSLRKASTEARAAFLEAGGDQAAFDAYQAGLPELGSLRERQALELMLLAVPEGAGKSGYATWLAEYAPVLDFVVRTESLDTQVYQEAFVLSAGEDALLGRIERARPLTTEERAWAAWFAVVEPYLEKSIDTVAQTSSDAAVMAFARMRQSMPPAGGDVDGTTWLVEADEAFVAAYPALRPGSARAMTRLSLLEGLRPAAGGGKSYRVWLNRFGQSLSEALQDSSLDATEHEAITRWVKVRPCGVDEEGQAGYDRLAGRRDAIAGAVPALGEIIDQAAPAACGESTPAE